MHFEEGLFGFWRQSQDRSQSIFCIYNITPETRELALKDVNLIELDDWRDLVSGHRFTDPRETVTLRPYEFVWITNQ
jgi:sucrose phosphorylase